MEAVNDKYKELNKVSKDKLLPLLASIYEKYKDKMPEFKEFISFYDTVSGLMFSLNQEAAQNPSYDDIKGFAERCKKASIVLKEERNNLDEVLFSEELKEDMIAAKILSESLENETKEEAHEYHAEDESESLENEAREEAITSHEGAKRGRKGYFDSAKEEIKKVIIENLNEKESNLASIVKIVTEREHNIEPNQYFSRKCRELLNDLLNNGTIKSKKNGNTCVYYIGELHEEKKSSKGTYKKASVWDEIKPVIEGIILENINNKELKLREIKELVCNDSRTNEYNLKEKTTLILKLKEILGELIEKGKIKKSTIRNYNIYYTGELKEDNATKNSEIEELLLKNVTSKGLDTNTAASLIISELGSKYEIKDNLTTKINCLNILNNLYKKGKIKIEKVGVKNIYYTGELVVEAKKEASPRIDWNLIKKEIKSAALKNISTPLTTSSLLKTLNDEELIQRYVLEKKAQARIKCKEALDELAEDGEIKVRKIGVEYFYFNKDFKIEKEDNATKKSDIEELLLKNVTSKGLDTFKAVSLIISELGSKYEIKDNLTTKINCLNILNELYKKGSIRREKFGAKYIYYTGKLEMPKPAVLEKKKVILSINNLNNEGIVDGRAVNIKGFNNIVLNNYNALLKERQTIDDIARTLFENNLIEPDKMTPSTINCMLRECLNQLANKQAIKREKIGRMYYYQNKEV